MGIVGLGCDGQYVSVAGEDVHLDHRLMRQAAAEARAFDTEAGDGPTQSDRLQLRNAQGHQAVGERRLDEVLVGGHAENLGSIRVGIDMKNPVERRHVQSAGRRILARTEQVGCGFCET